jgi:DNA polymerase IV
LTIEHMFYIIYLPMKILCVMLSHFPWRCEVRRNPALADRAAIVVQSKDAVSSQKVVVDWSPGIEGLARDMPLQQALARHDSAALIPSDIPCYRAAFKEILDGLEQVSPLVEGKDLGCVYISADGLHLIYPNDSALINAVREATADFMPQMGIAGNKFLSSLAAQQSQPDDCKIFWGDAAAFLKDLPCDVLPVSLKSRGKLRDFGIRRLGQVAAMSPGPLQSQFGLEGKRIWELAQGIDNTPLLPRFMEEVIEESVTLPSVTVSMDAIVTSAESILLRILPDIVRRGFGIRNLKLWTRTWNMEHWERDINFKEPAMDIKNAIARLKRALEDYPQPGPVEQIGIRINRLGYPLGRQRNLFADIRAQEHLADDIKQLELKLGNPQIYRVKEVEPWSRIPERRYALTPTSR